MTTPIERIRTYHRELTDIRRDLHAHPELSFQESRTSALVADYLKKQGIETHTGIAKTGVVGIVKGRHAASRGIALRADMDCLPVQSEDSFRLHCNLKREVFSIDFPAYGFCRIINALGQIDRLHDAQ